MSVCRNLEFSLPLPLSPPSSSSVSSLLLTLADVGAWNIYYKNYVYYSSWFSMRRIFDFYHFICYGMETLPYVWKTYHKYEWNLCLGVHISPKLSQNVYLINTHILIHFYVRCDCKLSLFYYISANFPHKWRIPYLKFCTSTKFSQIVCLIYAYTHHI